MAATGATLHPGLSARVRSRTTGLPHGWPLYAIFLGYPLWWALGVSEFIWPVFAGPMLLSLIGRRQSVRVPRGYGLLILFLIWMCASGLMISGPDRMIGFVYRCSLYFSAAIMLLYVYNAPKRLLPLNVAVRTMAFFWVIVVFGGLFGIIAPDFEITSVAERLMPARLLANDYVYSLVHPTTAQTQVFLGYPVPRPRAPFVYTNDWGGNFALLVPFLLAGWSQIRSFARRGLLKLLAVVSLLPVVFSLNRTLWLCLGVTFVYGATRFAVRGNKGAIQSAVLVSILVFGVFTFGPTRQLIDDRIATPHSNQGRSRLYNEAVDNISRSPWLGYGAPRPSEVNPNLPSVGTQGQFWMVLFSHGIPGAIFFTSFLGYACWRTRKARNQAALWCHTVVLLALVQMPFYGLLPTQLNIVFLAIALAFREKDQPDPVPMSVEGPFHLATSARNAPVVTMAAAPLTNGRALPPSNGNGNGSHA